MYSDFQVKILDTHSGISQKTIRGTTYVYYSYSRKYMILLRNIPLPTIRV